MVSCSPFDVFSVLATSATRPASVRHSWKSIQEKKRDPSSRPTAAVKKCKRTEHKVQKVWASAGPAGLAMLVVKVTSFLGIVPGRQSPDHSLRFERC